MKRAFVPVLLLAPCLAMAHDPAPTRVPLDAVTLGAQPHEAVDVEVHGQALHCSGVPLLALLREAGAMPAKPLHGAQLARIVRASARDGYRVVFSLAELDPTLGNARVFVVDACAGKPLDEHEGPLRLLVPGDARPARGVRQLQAIDVIDAP